MAHSDQASFIEFMSRLASSRDVSLAIAPDVEAVAELADLAAASGFTRCVDAIELAAMINQPACRLFIEVTAGLPKLLYDLIVQYPTGQVQLSSPGSTINVTPGYQGAAVLVLATEAAASQAQGAGFRLLESVGLCWRPEARQ